MRIINPRKEAMLKNRALLVKLIPSRNEDALPQATELRSTFEQKVAFIGPHFEHAMKKVALVVIAYIAMDTLRQVLVAKAEQTND